MKVISYLDDDIYHNVEYLAYHNLACSTCGLGDAHLLCSMLLVDIYANMELDTLQCFFH